MRIFRYIFLLMLVGCSTSVGFLISKKYADRIIELTIFKNLINILQNKIKFTHKPLPEALEEISKLKENSKISQIFFKASQKIHKQKTEDAWKEAIKEERFFLNMTNEDISLIENLGNVLGKTDIEGQISELSEFNILISNQLKKAHNQHTKNEKLYKSLGTIVGLALAVIFY